MRPSSHNLTGLRPWLAGVVLAFVASFGGQAMAATAASGQGIGLTADVSVAVPVLDLPLADTELQQASEGTALSFDKRAPVVDLAGPNAVDVLGLLELSAGAIDGQTQGDLLLNKVTSSAGVVEDGNTPGLSIKSRGLLAALGLSITADVVESAVEASCSATGQPKVTSSVNVANLKVDAFGLGLVDLPVPQDLNNELLNIDLGMPVLGLGTVKVAELKIISHEATVNAAGEREVNALRVKLKVLDIDLFLLKLTGLNLDLKVGTSYAKLDNCSAPNPGGVQVDTDALPDINPDNVTDYPVSGVCTVNSGDNTVTIIASNSHGQTAQTTASCDAAGNFASENFDVSSLDDGPVTITVAQGNASDFADVNKNTVVITLDTLTQITEGNQADYPVSGTCWGDGGAISVVATDQNNQTASASNALCDNGSYATSGFDVSQLANGPITITVDHFGGTASGNTTKDVDNGTLALGVLANIDPSNQGAYVVSGSCNRMEGAVSVTATGQGGSPVSVTVSCDNSRQFTATLNVTDLPDGEVTIAATQGDVTVDRVVSKDTSRIGLDANQPSIDDANQHDYPVSGTCKKDGGDVTITFTDKDGRTVKATAVCNSDGTFSAGVDVHDLVDGEVGIEVEQDGDTDGTSVNKDTGPKPDAIFEDRFEA